MPDLLLVLIGTALMTVLFAPVLFAPRKDGEVWEWVNSPCPKCGQFLVQEETDYYKGIPMSGGSRRCLECGSLYTGIEWCRR